MKWLKQSFAKLATVGILAFAVFGLAACGGSTDYQELPTQTTEYDLSFLDDFPEWWRESMTEEHKQMFLDVLTPEELEELREQAESLGENGPPHSEGTQQVIVPPGGGAGGGTFVVTEDGLVPIDE